jgi:hypothetical protein
MTFMLSYTRVHQQHTQCLKNSVDCTYCDFVSVCVCVCVCVCARVRVCALAHICEHACVLVCFSIKKKKK